jgi:iron complex outermembrane receptor protein
MFKAELGYDDGALFAKVGFDYIDERFFTYLNDRKVDDRTLIDLSVGYRLRGMGFVEEVTMQFNAVNITDENYISTVGSAGYGNSGDRQTLLNGAPAQYFFTVDARF